ncbi:MAG: helix-turn-helix transcriptional regulator [Clostridia bacterium]|nr:helix-turn-helix transcriptional regulator [Clostridia bacterium]
MKLDILKNTNFHCSFFECHKQAWTQNSEWIGYKHTPRPTNAFVMIHSDMKMEFRLKSGKSFVARKGDVIFIPKDLYYTVSFFDTSNQFDSYTVNFLLSDELCNEIVFDEEIQIFKSVFDKTLLFVAEELFKAYLCRENNRVKAMAQFYSFLDVVLLLTSYDARYYYPIKKGIERMINEWNENNKIEYYARQCGVDKSYFYKLFKLWSGISPNQYRNTLRMTAAKDLLMHTNLSVCEIAHKIGFDDPYYFSRLFKKEIGLSPVHYRKTNPL